MQWSCEKIILSEFLLTIYPSLNVGMNHADMQQNITPFFWFDDKAEEAMKFYVDVFNGGPNKKQESKIISIARYEKGIESPGAEEMEGKVLTGEFELNGQRLMCLDGGPIFKFNESISLMVETDDQAETDYFWEKLIAGGGEESVCGWLKDKYGLSWQITPKRLTELTKDSDRAKAHRVFNCMLKMKKIVISELEQAAQEEK